MLKRKIIERLVLGLPDFDKILQVETNGSGIVVGVVFIQEQRPIAYFSENLNEAKKNYSSYDKEFYAIVKALKKRMHYLLPK